VAILFHAEVDGPLGPASSRPERRRWSLSLLLSAAIHGVLLTVLFWRVAPVFVKPVFLARGQGGAATPIAVALTWPKSVTSPALPSPLLLSRAASVPERKKTATKLRKRSNQLDNPKPSNAAEAGSPQGSAFDGAAEGDEIRPGFAVSFAPPRVSRWELPGGKEGDVVVELTIDAQGNVVEEKLLQGIGPDIDQRVIATLRVWRFRPATRNGIAIPFKYDARFHFPS
jgi:TonB family protein